MNLARRNSIKKLIEEKGRVSFDELVKRYPTVSTMTIRRDLLALEEAGSLIRVRGGAVSVKELNRNVEDVYTQRTGYNIEAKKEIAKKAAEFADRGHSIFIDSGSTMLYFTKELLDINYYVTTNGLNVAQELSSKTMPVVTFIGGVINKRNMSASGNLSQVFLDNINIDIAFLAASGFSVDSGFMCGSLTETYLKSAIVKKAQKRIMLMDSSKIDKSMPFTFASVDDVDVLITDSGFPQELKEQLKGRIEIL